MSTACETCKALREVIAAKDALIAALSKPTVIPAPQPYMPAPTPYVPQPVIPVTPNVWRQPLGGANLSGCPCRKENGGSGVCGCTLSGISVTSATGGTAMGLS